MGLLNKLTQNKFFRKITYPLTFSLMVPFLGCEPSSSSNPTDNDSTGNGNNNGGYEEYYENEGNTNSQGEVGIEIDGQKFDIRVRGGSENLGGAFVQGDNYEGIYIFLASDPNGVYYANKKYIYSTQKSPASWNDVLIDLRYGSDEVEVVDAEVNNYVFPNPEKFNFVGTFPFSLIESFYQEHDALVRNAILLEFMANVTGAYEFQIASKLNQARSDFLGNVSNWNKVVDKIASLVGSHFHEKAYYLDGYAHKMSGIVTNCENEDRLCTLEGIVKDMNGNPLSGVEIEVNNGYTSDEVHTNSQGEYTLYYIDEGGYLVFARAGGYESQTTNWQIIFTEPPYYEVNLLNFNLREENQTNLDTLVLKPGSGDGKDTYLRRAYVSGNHSYDGSGPNDEILWCGFDKDGSLTAINRVFLEFTQLPENLNVRSAKLSFYGWPVESSSVSFRLYANSSSWNENMSWNSQPSLNTNLYKDFTVYNYGTMTEVDVTNIVSHWSNYSNNGLVIKLVTEDGYSSDRQIQFYSSDNSSSSLRPELEVVYEY